MSIWKVKALTNDESEYETESVEHRERNQNVP